MRKTWFVWTLFVSAANADISSTVIAVDGSQSIQEEKQTLTVGNFTFRETDSIEHFLNPKLFEDLDTLETIKESIKAGHAVVIRDAFLTEFAEAMHKELLEYEDKFVLHDYHDEEDRFHCHHHNIYTFENYSPLMNGTMLLLNSDRTKEFVSELSGRDCYGDTEPSASLYYPKDHSLPHTDYYGQRSVAYVWHLTKDWKTGWGGHLYWCNEHASNAFLDASFNTLVLFSVTALSSHLVTAVSPEATGKRLTINGWWDAAWEPTFEEEFEDYYEDDEELMEFTDYQYKELRKMADDCENGDEPDDVSDERCEKIVNLWNRLHQLFEPEELEAMTMIEL